MVLVVVVVGTSVAGTVMPVVVGPRVVARKRLLLSSQLSSSARGLLQAPWLPVVVGPCVVAANEVVMVFVVVTGARVMVLVVVVVGTSVAGTAVMSVVVGPCSCSEDVVIVFVVVAGTALAPWSCPWWWTLWGLQRKTL